MDTTTQWPQGIVVKPIEETVTINTCPNNNNDDNNNDFERNSNKLARPKESLSSALNCPRCNSTNTKFCYYNNYSLTQPRHFCKSCRRYWTNGGSLRSIPVGGASRKKNKRSSSSSSGLSSKSRMLPDLIQPQRQDLELGFPSNHVFTPHHQEKNNSLSTSTTTSATSRSHLSAMELLNGFTSRGLNSSFNNGGVYTPSLFPMSDLMVKPTLNFSLDGIGSGYETSDLQGQENSGRLLFPFEDLKSNKEHQNGNGDSNGYWSGMLGGGTW